MIGRLAHVIASAAITAVALSSCNIDFEPPSMVIRNQSDVTVSVTVSGTGQLVVVRPGEQNAVGLKGCEGSSIIVTEENSGREIVTLDRQACPDTMLVIDAEEHVSVVAI